MTLGEFRFKTQELPDDFKLVYLKDPRRRVFIEVGSAKVGEFRYMGEFFDRELYEPGEINSNAIAFK